MNHTKKSPEQNVRTGRLADKICVITGGGQGIGRAAAELFSHESAKVFIIEKNEHLGREAAEACGEKASFLKVDIADPAQVEAAFDLIKKQC
ncbi:MAG: SDR family NAD(P)-dependent oxidoreductase [Victivallaceae bacterium]|nr:SDR family NAD(P)-dependent oxidoreductase [Victivallaceae bacterium]